jgi:cytochrome P450
LAQFVWALSGLCKFTSWPVGNAGAKTTHRLGGGIFSANGPQWEHSRALLRPQFARQQVSDLDLEEDHLQDMFKAMPVKADGWTDTIDLLPLFFRLTLDSSSEFLFGESVGTQLAALPGHDEIEWRKHADFVQAFEMSQDCIARAFRLNDFWAWGITKQYKEYCVTVHRYIDTFVQKALNLDEKQLESGEKRKYVFLEELAQVTRDPIEIRDQLLSILVAGRDTTAGLLCFLFRELASHPQAFEKLRSAILYEFGTDNTKLTFASLKDCQYLQWCLNETLRLFPSVPMNSRMAKVDTTLPRGGGPDGTQPLYIPKGTEVNYSVYAMHRTKEFWGENAEEFDPERWNGRKPGFEYLPFNGGPRYVDALLHKLLEY